MIALNSILNRFSISINPNRDQPALVPPPTKKPKKNRDRPDLASLRDRRRIALISALLVAGVSIPPRRHRQSLQSSKKAVITGTLPPIFIKRKS